LEALNFYIEVSSRAELYLKGGNLLKADLHLLKMNLVAELSRLGFNAAICIRCDKIFERNETGGALCPECQKSIKKQRPIPIF
jgi:hypothetical protein